MPDIIIHDLVKFNKPGEGWVKSPNNDVIRTEILNEVAALEIFQDQMVYYKIRFDSRQDSLEYLLIES